MRSLFEKISTALVRVCLCILILAPSSYAYRAIGHIGLDKEQALQAADILEMRPQVDRLIELERSSTYQSEEALLLRSIVLRKILEAVLEVRQAENKIDFELTYSYDVMKREQLRQQKINQLFNLANFAQLSTFYTMEPFARIHHQFVKSAIFTTVGNSLGTSITVASKLHARVAKANNVAPPKILEDVVDGKAVDTTGMPPVVTKFLDSKEPNSTKTRREELFDMWKKDYNIDASKEENLCSIAGKKKASVGLLSNRVLLLWSLHTFVQDFDRELLLLLEQLKVPRLEAAAGNGEAAANYSPGANEVVDLMKMRPLFDELAALRHSNVESDRRDQLELMVLESILQSALEVQVAADKVDEELNYNYHIVLSKLYADRAKWLQYNYNMNFLQTGILGIIAGRLYLARMAYAGDQMFVISGGIGTGLTGLAIMQNHGFWRKVDTGPNSLAQILDLNPPTEYRFSPFVSGFLNSAPPGSTDGKTRAQILNDVWKEKKIATIDLNKTKNKQAVAAMPPHTWDTIKQVSNRVDLLQSLKKELESFQGEVLDLLQATD